MRAFLKPHLSNTYTYSFWIPCKCTRLHQVCSTHYTMSYCQGITYFPLLRLLLQQSNIYNARAAPSCDLVEKCHSKSKYTDIPSQPNKAILRGIHRDNRELLESFKSRMRHNLLREGALIFLSFSRIFFLFILYSRSLDIFKLFILILACIAK